LQDNQITTRNRPLEATEPTIVATDHAQETSSIAAAKQPHSPSIEQRSTTKARIEIALALEYSDASEVTREYARSDIIIIDDMEEAKDKERQMREKLEDIRK
jgi:hypothetical protein